MGEIRRIRGTEAEAFKRLHVGAGYTGRAAADFHERVGQEVGAA